MAFPEAAVAQLLADCKRHCCVCWRWCGSKTHVHHIIPRTQDGPDEIDNAIPVCLDCHAEIESRGNMGRQFSRTELREHKRRWLEICRDHPEVVVQSSRAQPATGPLEALLSELEYNAVLLTGDDHRADYATLAVGQFDRAIAANALSTLDAAARERVYRVYKLITETADLIRARMMHPPGGNPFNTISNQIREKRLELRAQVASTIECLRLALGAEE
ncbi:MAG: HNH endonuclease [Vicinamibacterales bacterium]